MSKSFAFEADFLELIFNNTNIPNGICPTGTGTLANLQVSLHTADPGNAGTQATSEATYAGYTRVAVARSGAGWTVTAGTGTGTGAVASVSPVATIAFPASTGTATNAITHFGVGSDTGTLAGNLYYSGTVVPTINVSSGVTPQLTTGSTITED